MATDQVISLSQKCCSMRDLKRIHALVFRNNLHQNHLVLAKLLRFLAVSPSGDLPYAHKFFSLIPNPNTFFYNTLIRGFAKGPSPSSTISLFNTMRSNTIPPDEFTFTFLLKARSRFFNSHSIMGGGEIHGQLFKFGFTSHLFVANALIHLYASSRLTSAARCVFDQIRAPDVVSWSGLVVAYIKAGELESARHVFDEMPDRDVVSWTAMISAFAKEGRSREALGLFHEMQAVGVTPDEVTMVSVVSACASLGDLEAGLRVHRYAVDNNFSWMVSLGNALIDMFSKCGCMDMAWQVFESMERKSLISWNSMISGCAVHGMAEEAAGLFMQLLDEGRVKPDGVTFLGVLNACAHKGWADEGRRMFVSMQGYGVEAGIEHYGCMVDMLGRAGFLEEAYLLIKNMPIPSNDVVWGALLGACRIHGHVEMGERVLNKLLELKPGEGGYYVLLCNIYDEAGRQVEASDMRRMMKDRGAKKNPGCSWVGT